MGTSSAGSPTGSRKGKKAAVAVTASTAAAGRQQAPAAKGPAASNPIAAGLHSSRSSERTAADSRGCSRFMPSKRSSKCITVAVVVALVAAAAIGVGITLTRRGASSAEEDLPPVDGFLVVRNMKVGEGGVKVGESGAGGAPVAADH
jgi:hypothetical protein